MKCNLIVLSIIILVSCNNSQNKSDKITNSTDEQKETVTCYTYSKDSSNIMMQITRKGNLITGYLVYDYFEKDKNRGTLKGAMQGDTLFADYNFMSEGMNSIRQVAFLKKDDEFIEGYGDVEEQKGKTVFKNKAALKFENNITLKRSDCK